MAVDENLVPSGRDDRRAPRKDPGIGTILPCHECATDTVVVVAASRNAAAFRNVERVARRKLLQINAATELASLRVPPGNHLEALKSDRNGQYSIRIDDQWRVCFVWKPDGAHRVWIVDYH